jgi:hypothetical protein
VDTKCRRVGLQRNETPSAPTAAYTEQKIAKNNAMWVLSCFALFCFTCLSFALHVEQVNERKLVCVWCGVVCGAWEAAL